MVKTNLDRSILWKGIFATLFLGLLLALTPRSALAQEIGNFCVRDYQSGATCTANDVRIEELRIVQVVKACNVAPTGYLDVVFEALVSSAGSPDRYDIGLFLATDGGSALTGDSCYHDYLPPPITTSPTYGDKNSDGIPDIDNGPWWNGEPGRADTCGDIQTDTQVFRVTQQIRVACVDLDDDGAADISVCSSWDNNSNSDCSSVKQAFPGTGSKCSCAVVNFDFTPTALEVTALTARSQDSSKSSMLAVLGVVFIGGGATVYTGVHQRRKRTT